VKYCGKCKEWKERSEFYKQKGKPGGLQAMCKPCRKVYRAKYYQANKDKHLAWSKADYEKNKERRKADVRAWTRRNPDYVARWQKANPGKVRAIWMRRHAAKLQRTPIWSETAAIALFYESCPQGHEVDHIIPLRGKVVSGLHVLANLQYLTIHDNRTKKNKYCAETLDRLIL